MAHETSLMRAVLAAALLAGIAAAGPAAAQQRVGINSAVNTQATGIPPNAPPRALIIGQPVIFNEHITTNPSGQTQILFVDESTMSIGPRSDLVIDRFVYNPATGTGAMTANLARGIFRYIGGKLSKVPNAVSMTTPAATIGIRGAVVLIGVNPDGRVEVIFEYGRGVTVTGRNGVEETITRPGYEVIVTGPGASPSAPFPVPPDTTERILAALDGRPGAHGGAPVIPTNAMVENSLIARTVSGDLPASVAVALLTQPPPPKAPPTVSVTILNNQANVNTVASQGAPLRTVTGAGTGLTVAGLHTIAVAQTGSGPQGTLAGQFISTQGSGTARGFAGQGTPYQRGVLSNGTFTALIAGEGSLQIPLRTGFLSFGANGTMSPLGPVSGTSFLAPDGSFFYAELTPASTPGEREFIYGGQGVAASFYGPSATARLFAFNVAPDAALGSAIPFIRSGTGGALPNPTVSPFLLATPANVPFAGAGAASTRSLQASLAIDGQGAAQRSVLIVSVGNALTATDTGQPVLNGQIAGSYRAGATSPPVRIASGFLTPSDGNGNSFYGGASLSGFAVNQNNSNGAAVPSLATETAYPSLSPTATYGFTQAVTGPTGPTGVTQTSRTETGYFGGMMRQFGGPGATYAVTGTTSVTTDATNLRVAAQFSGQNPLVPDASGVSTVTMQFGGLTGPTRSRQGYIDDSQFAALESPLAPSQINNAPLIINGDPLQAAHLYMVTSGTVPSSALLPSGVSYCQCQYLQWGYWGGELDTPNAAGTAPARADVGHINTWLAGTPTSLADISALAGANVTGTYTGAMTGAVSNNGAQYLAAGGFTASYNFASRNGSFAVNDYDGHSFTATIPPGTHSGATYAFPVNVGGLTGKIQGGFYGPQAIETGGSFAFRGPTGTNYLTSGIFAGRR